VIFQVQKAGFVLDKISDMFYQESDDLSQEVGAIPNMTDRFFFVFKKPSGLAIALALAVAEDSADEYRVQLNIRIVLPGAF
jgi:hypothetical protein